jgi:exonuclease VII large subunit
LSSQTLAATQQRIGTSALTLIPQHLMQINQQVMQLNNHSMNRINRAKQLLENNALHVHLANPQHILEKGYALVKNKHGYLTKQNTVVSGEKISTRLSIF